MADPARYYIDPILDAEKATAGLHIERSPSGEWIKWSDFKDYKDAQRRNSGLETNTKLGMEIVELRGELEHMKQCIKTLQNASLMLINDRQKNSK